MQKDKWVIFSDHHRGSRDGADDFRNSENAYHAALGYYLERGFHLALLGDVEELWEVRPESALEVYCSTLKLEQEFYLQDRYWRFWGNHDDAWSHSSMVDESLGPIYPGLRVRESLLLSVTDGGEEEIGKFLLVHGHQGTLASDVFGWFSRWPVQLVWRPIQRIFGISLNTPAKDWGLLQKHNIALYNWAVCQEGLVLIAGHTHRPVFDASQRVIELGEELKKAKEKGDPECIAEARARVEYAKVRQTRSGFPMDHQPCYFNTGCCSYEDGDITGLEIDSGKIRLVRWPDNYGRPRRKLLAEEDLRRVFCKVADKGVPVGLSQYPDLEECLKQADKAGSSRSG